MFIVYEKGCFGLRLLIFFMFSILMLGPVQASETFDVSACNKALSLQEDSEDWLTGESPDNLRKAVHTPPYWIYKLANEKLEISTGRKASPSYELTFRKKGNLIVVTQKYKKPDHSLDFVRVVTLGFGGIGKKCYVASRYNYRNSDTYSADWDVRSCMAVKEAFNRFSLKYSDSDQKLRANEGFMRTLEKALTDHKERILAVMPEEIASSREPYKRRHPISTLSERLEKVRNLVSVPADTLLDAKVMLYQCQKMNDHIGPQSRPHEETLRRGDAKQERSVVN